MFIHHLINRFSRKNQHNHIGLSLSIKRTKLHFFYTLNNKEHSRSVTFLTSALFFHSTSHACFKSALNMVLTRKIFRLPKIFVWPFSEGLGWYLHSKALASFPSPTPYCLRWLKAINTIRRGTKTQFPKWLHIIGRIVTMICYCLFPYS